RQRLDCRHGWAVQWEQRGRYVGQLQHGGPEADGGQRGPKVSKRNAVTAQHVEPAEDALPINAESAERAGAHEVHVLRSVKAEYETHSRSIDQAFDDGGVGDQLLDTTQKRGCGIVDSRRLHPTN